MAPNKQMCDTEGTDPWLRASVGVLLRVEDQGITPPKASQMVARKFRLKETAVGEIANEGLARGWPMP